MTPARPICTRGWSFPGPKRSTLCGRRRLQWPEQCSPSAACPFSASSFNFMMPSSDCSGQPWLSLPISSTPSHTYLGWYIWVKSSVDKDLMVVTVVTPLYFHLGDCHLQLRLAGNRNQGHNLQTYFWLECVKLNPTIHFKDAARCSWPK